MKTIAPPPAPTEGRMYDETFRVPGGALCLDFCNTGQATRDSRGIEWLPGFADLLDWLEAAGALSHAQGGRLRRAAKADPDAATAAWKRALALRETLFRVFNAVAGRGAAARADLDSIRASYAATLGSSVLEWSGDRYAWRLDSNTASLPAVVQPIIDSAVELMTSDMISRLRRCRSASCHWLFLDETRNHSRRWCEMASCGNLAKVRRHREKGRATHAC